MEEIKDLIKQIRNAKKRIIWSSKTVQVETRALKCEWTREMIENVSRYSGIDSSIEEELVNTLLKELGNDIL